MVVVGSQTQELTIVRGVREGYTAARCSGRFDNNYMIGTPVLGSFQFTTLQLYNAVDLHRTAVVVNYSPG